MQDYDFSQAYQSIAQEVKLQPWLAHLPQQLIDWQQGSNRHRNIWHKALKKLPEYQDLNCQLLDEVSVTTPSQMTQGDQAKLKNLLEMFHPWRKGPYHLHHIHLDTEWRSDWKWQRLLPHITPLDNRLVLDVGCGNGYHMWRMLGAGARMCMGIDPSDLFLYQFAAIHKLMGGRHPIHLLPIGIESMPALGAFDTVFSMGVLYHRRSPLDHLIQLKNQLVEGGELILETLVIDGGANQVLVPGGRYAQMHNVYFFPSALALKGWLEKVGFCQVRIVDQTVTSLEEQRSTAWMKHQSLPNYLDVNDNSKTIEGYPAPKRAILIAKRPIQ